MDKSPKNRGGIQRQGDLHENAALELIGGDAVNLNNHPKLEGMDLPFGNYPTYDIFSSTEICSVKSHMGDDKIQAYKSDFSKILGWNKSTDALDQDAQRITECASRGIPIPQELIGANPDQIVSFLQDKSIMRIPSDHVEEVRFALVADATDFPSNYFLPENPSEEQFQNLSNRIQSTGMSSAETLEKLTGEEQPLSESMDIGQSVRDTVNVKAPSTQETLEEAQETTEISQENPLNDVLPDKSENEDYDYCYGY